MPDYVMEVAAELAKQGKLFPCMLVVTVRTRFVRSCIFLHVGSSGRTYIQYFQLKEYIFEDFCYCCLFNHILF